MIDLKKKVTNNSFFPDSGLVSLLDIIRSLQVTRRTGTYTFAHFELLNMASSISFVLKIYNIVSFFKKKKLFQNLEDMIILLSVVSIILVINV